MNMKNDYELPKIVLNPETGVVQDANASACQYYGLSSDQLVGHNLNALGHIDILTGLPNRQLFLDRLSQAVAESKRNHQVLALLFIDLDRFKPINDSLGHEAGDEVLKKVASRVQQCIRDEDTLARLGGDEFVVLLKNIQQVLGIEQVAQKILSALVKPFNIANTTVEIGGSLGISISPQDAITGDDLLHKADLAMYRAKNNGRNQWAFFKTEMDVEARFRHTVESVTREALDNELFSLTFDPIIDTTNNSLFALESKLTWQPHGLDSAVQIEDIIALAETVHLGIELNQWQICHALQLLSQSQACQSDLVIIVPLTPIHFRQKGLITWLEALLAKSDAEPSRLMLSLTPACLIMETLDVVKRVSELTDLGVQMMVEGFGQHGSALFQMANFELAAIKLMDFNLSKKLASLDRKGEKLAAATIAFAKALNPIIIGSGIISLDQQSFMQSQHCTIMQGAFLANEIHESALENFLIHRHDNWNDFNEKDISDETLSS